MLARPLIVCACSTIAALAGGCCCCPTACGPCGGPGGACCFCLPRPIVWTGECHECGPHGESCADCCGDCGLLAWLIRGKTCGKGCGEIYVGEWISDPPDCCDPCDQCHGCWTGAHGACRLGPFQRLLAACHGYKYCHPPDCGPWCGGLCHRGECDPACGCGGIGCADCGGGPHGAVLAGGPAYGGTFYGKTVGEGVLPPPANVNLSPAPAEEPHNVMEENWNIPKRQPVPGKPIHKAQQPPRSQMSYLQHSRSLPAIGTGVRQANYQR